MAKTQKFKFEARVERMQGDAGWKVVDNTFMPPFTILVMDPKLSSSLLRATATAIAERLNQGVDVEGE